MKKILFTIIALCLVIPGYACTDWVVADDAGGECGAGEKLWVLVENHGDDGSTRRTQCSVDKPVGGTDVVTE